MCRYNRCVGGCDGCVGRYGGGCIGAMGIGAMGALRGVVGALVGTMVSAWVRSVGAMGALRSGMGPDSDGRCVGAMYECDGWVGRGAMMGADILIV